MHIRFIQDMDSAEKQALQETMAQIAAGLSRWAPAYPTLRVEPRVPGMALMTASCVPLPLPGALLTAKLIAWIFAVDDALDERQVTLAEAAQKAELWLALADGGRPAAPVAGDELSLMFAELCAELSTYQLFEQLKSFWLQSLRQLLAVAQTEYAWALQGARPTLDEYLAVGQYSIAMYFWSASIMIMSGDASILPHLAHISEVLAGAALAIRIYNDVRSYERERREGVVNALAVQQQALIQQGLPAAAALPQARQQLMGLAGAAVTTVLEQTAAPRTATGFIETVLARLVDFHAYYYGASHNDYHITTQADAEAILSRP